MRIVACDVCLQESKGTKVVAAPWRWKLGGGMLSFDVCKEHRDFFKGLGPDEANAKFLKAGGGSIYYPSRA